MGKVLARKFAQQGYNVVVVARQADRCYLRQSMVCISLRPESTIQGMPAEASKP